MIRTGTGELMGLPEGLSEGWEPLAEATLDEPGVLWELLGESGPTAMSEELRMTLEVPGMPRKVRVV